MSTWVVSDGGSADTRRCARAGLRTGLFIVAGAGMVLQAGVMAGCGPADPSARSASRPAVARLVERLTVQQLAGQLVIYSYRGLRPPAALLRRISAGQAAKVIFFRDNLGSSAQIRAVIGQLQQAAARSPVTAPLLLMTDQEGGVVRRLPGAPALSEKQIGASTDPLSAARTAGQGAGRNLRAVGMNVNLAPVLDVFRAPGNFIDRFGRSYSSNPRTVSKLGSAFIVAQQQAGVAATAKHFPGLGAATPEQNTDDRAVTLRLPLAELRAKEELPYRSAISAKVGLVMVSWATYPALDPRRPAGLSSKIVQGELRGRLKFRGVTITDSIGAHALRSFGATPQRAVLAARAGMDLLLCAGRSVRQGTSVVHALATALANGRLDLARVQASVSRVIALRASLASARR